MITIGSLAEHGSGTKRFTLPASHPTFPNWTPLTWHLPEAHFLGHRLAVKGSVRIDAWVQLSAPGGSVAARLVTTNGSVLDMDLQDHPFLDRRRHVTPGRVLVIFKDFTYTGSVMIEVAQFSDRVQAQNGEAGISIEGLGW